MKKAAVIQFLGSNCDEEAIVALQKAGFNTKKVFYKDGLEDNYDLVLVPGGFSYGDYLRSGAVAAKMPIMQDVASHAKRGAWVLGICNGFQVLTESKILPGALLRANSGKFVCKDVYLKTEDKSCPAFNGFDPVFKVQIAHADGRYFDEESNIKALEDAGGVLFRYSSKDGLANEQSNPNGSLNNIAGIVGGDFKNVIGLMPHPERMTESGLSAKFFARFA